MSRIHEALKKAEQERSVTRPPEETLAPVAFPEVAAPLPRPAETRSLVPAVAQSADGLTFDAIRDGSRASAWNFDPRTVLFGTPRPNENKARLGTEEFRTLRSRLYQIRERQPLKTILVTSALPAEGKTFVAANLAQVIVRQHERRALLVDADLRWSRMHLSFGTSMKPGLTDYLSGQVDELSIIQRGAYDNLFFVPGGSPSSNPAELLASGKMEAFLRKMAPLFDWVILDSPPAVPVSDASLLADMCDGVLMVVRSAVTPYDMAQRAVQEFREKHLVGVVLNDVEPGSGYSSYYYHYYHGRSGVNGKGKG
ncbi:MAG TPA: CpsD/CapB family tyrosine-protein kinase [Candidatus Acidoferrales bacterium]|jgi:capsular exopolysaccharide synthesis family protein|nr:CpsD/CapB family tyrosine-protein kinase [Candidatus Acidoferrales bacterium]